MSTLDKFHMFIYSINSYGVPNIYIYETIRRSGQEKESLSFCLHLAYILVQKTDEQVNNCIYNVILIVSNMKENKI